MAGRGRMLSRFESLLTDQGCPICAQVAEAERSFFSWFAIENYATAEVQRRLRSAMGFCRAHARRLIDERGAGNVMTAVMREALTGARQTLLGETEPGGCPACEAADLAGTGAVGVLVDGLAVAGNAGTYAEHAGVCLPHLRQAAPAETVVLDRLAGADPDAARRALWRRGLPSERDAESTLDGLCDRLAVHACPVCLSTGWMERRYVDWLIAGCAGDDDWPRRDPGELCPAHLHDVAVTDPTRGALAIKRQASATASELRRLRERITDAAPTRQRRRATGPRANDSVMADLRAARHCPACHARNEIERTQLTLVASSLALAPVRERYEHGHGLCVRHVMQSDSPVARRHAHARIAVLAWEIEETARKYTWAARHEPPGPEHDGWLRALAQIDGGVLEGAPAGQARSVRDSQPR